MSRIHTVRQGEFLAKIAKHYHFSNWRTIYDHPDNADFRRKRPNPNVIYPGDKIFIPDPERRWENAPTEQSHRFRLTVDSLLIRIRFQDADGEPMSDQAYVLTIGEVEYPGQTDGEGLLEEKIRPDADRAQVRFEDSGLILPLAIGSLDPVEDTETGTSIVSGAQARLNNLGYTCGAVDGDSGPKTQAAVRAFQRQVMNRDDPDGEIDQETRDELAKQYGC